MEYKADELVKTIDDLTEAIKTFVEKFTNVIETFKELIPKVVEKMKEKSKSTITRYKICKLISKCTEIDKRKFWIFWYKARSSI